MPSVQKLIKYRNAILELEKQIYDKIIVLSNEIDEIL